MKIWSRCLGLKGNMQIQVRFAEPFWRVIGQRNITLELEENANIAMLLALLQQQYPKLTAEFEESPPMIFVGEDEASADTILEDDNTVHLVWPIAGG